MKFSKLTATLAGEPVIFMPMEYCLLKKGAGEKSGKYILLSVDCDDDGTVIDNPNIRVGDTVRINHLKAEELSTTITDRYDFIILAKVRANENTAATRNTGESRFYLPTDIFLPLCDNPIWSISLLM